MTLTNRLRPFAIGALVASGITVSSPSYAGARGGDLLNRFFDAVLDSGGRELGKSVSPESVPNQPQVGTGQSGQSLYPAQLPLGAWNATGCMLLPPSHYEPPAVIYVLPAPPVALGYYPRW